MFYRRFIVKNEYGSCVFNFSSSHFGGGLKRILAYVEWFNEHGGSNFVLNEKLREIEDKFPKNKYCFLKQNPFNKILNYYKELNQFLSTIGTVEFYFSYGIPIPRKIGKVNWIHVANVLPFVNAGQYVPFKRSLELRLLGFLMRNSMKYAEVISAESEASLDLVKNNSIAKRFVSVNGNNEEIEASQQQTNMPTLEVNNIAVAVGTCQYKSMTHG